MKGATSGAYAARTADAVAGPTPFKTVSSDTAFDTSGSDPKAFREEDSTASSSSDDTNSSNRGLEKITTNAGQLP